MKPTKWILVLIAYISLMAPGCSCQKDIIPYEYEFAEKVNLFPAKKLYNLGDTVWVQYANPNKMLFDSKTNEYKSADSVGLVFSIGLNNYYAITPIDHNAPFGNFISDQGMNIGRYDGYSSSSITQQFGCNTSNNYDFKIGIVFKQKGTFCLDLNRSELPVSPCSNPASFPYSSIKYRFNLADCNKDIYLDIPEHARITNQPGQTEGIIEDKKMFFFRVL